MKSQTKFKKIIAGWIFPITLLTLLTGVGLLMSIRAVIIAFTGDNNAAIYPAVMIPDTLLVLFLYTIDRKLTRLVPYYQLMIGEIIIGLLIFFIYSNQNRTADINFHTGKDYFLVLFDSKENSIARFSKKGIFGKKLNLYHTNILHLDSTMLLRKELRIHPPKEWVSYTTDRGKLKWHNQSIEYVFAAKDSLGPDFRKNPRAYIDSLLREEK